MSWTLTKLAPVPTSEFRVWRELLARAAIRHPMLDADYVELACTQLAQERSLHWLQYSHKGQIEIAAIVERLGWGRWASWDVPQLPVAPLLAAQTEPGSPPVGSGLFAALGATAWQLKLFDVDPAYGAVQGALSNLPQLAIATHQTVSIDLRAGTADYWASRSRELQRNLVRSIRKLETLAGVPRLLALDSAADMAVAVASHAALEQSGWKSSHGTAMHAGDSLGVFYRAVLERFAARNAARVYQLHAGGELIASQLCIVVNGILVTMKTTYHGRYASGSPGRVLDFLMLQQLQADAQVTRCEFCVHAGKADMQWATEVRALQQVEVYGGLVPQQLVAHGRGLQRRLMGRATSMATAS